MIDIPKKELRVKIFFRSQETFWGKPQYFHKELIFPENSNLESVSKAVIETFPKYLYFIYKGRAIKNENGGTLKK